MSASESATWKIGTRYARTQRCDGVYVSITYHMGGGIQERECGLLARSIVLVVA